MKIVVTTNGSNLEAQASPVFGRCPVYIFVDPETMQFEAVENQAANAAGGAGIQAAQFIVESGAQALITGNVGPNAFNVFQAANFQVYLFNGGTVRQAVEAYKAGKLPLSGSASAPDHAGMGGGRGMGAGRGMGMGRGMSMGAGRGMGRQTWGAAPQMPPPVPAPSRQAEIDDLKVMAGDLRGQLAEVLDRLDKLEKENK